MLEPKPKGPGEEGDGAKQDPKPQDDQSAGKGGEKPQDGNK